MEQEQQSLPNSSDFSLTFGDTTSPSQLQEVTQAEDTLCNSMGMRSPGSAPLRGRSVKEFEEQLSGLKKENFNLKLRIYFLEEKIGSSFSLEKEELIKKAVDLKVETENFKKEAREKQELLCQAVKAMDLQDEEHQRVVQAKDALIADFQSQVDVLAKQLLEKQESESLSPSCFDTAMSVTNSSAFKELQDKIMSMEQELNEEKENSAAIQIVLDQKDAMIKSLSAQVDELSSNSQDDIIRELTFALEETKGKYQGTLKKMEDKNRQLDELASAKVETQKRLALLSADLEREKRRTEKTKTSGEQKVADLQAKLESALAELKKSQDLVVSKSRTSRSDDTDNADSFSVQEPTTPAGSSQKDTLVFPTPTVTPPVASTPPHSVVATSTSASSSSSGVFDSCAIDRLVAERDSQARKIVKLKAEQMKACKIIKSMIDARNKSNEEMQQLRRRIDQLEKELEGVVSRPHGGGGGGAGGGTGGQKHERQVASKPKAGAGMEEEPSAAMAHHYKMLSDELEEKCRILESTLDEKSVQMRKLHEQNLEIFGDLKKREDRIVDLEFELLSANQDRSNSSLGSPTSKSEDLASRLLKQKDGEIRQLNEKLERRTNDLQGLVNKELWQKNREIEKLQKLQVSKIMECKDREIVKLEGALSSKEAQLSVIKEKISQLGIEVDLLEDGGVNFDPTANSPLQQELENSEKLRHEANELCAILSRRLAELAVFLDSLLKQKCVLGFLGHSENQRLRQIIDHSLDLSRSFTMNMIIDGDQSLMQLSNLSQLLADESKVEDHGDSGSGARLSLLPANLNLTYQNHLLCKKDDEENQKNIVEALRQQIVNLKYELQLRDVELNKLNVVLPGGSSGASSEKDTPGLKSGLNTTSTTLKCKTDDQSESEAWSEPDRTVSRARIGLLDESLKKRKAATNKHTEPESTEDDEDVPNSKNVLNESRTSIIELHHQLTEMEKTLNDREIAYFEVTKDNIKLTHELENLAEQLKSAESRFVEAEIKKYDTEDKLQVLEKEKNDLLVQLNKKDKDLQNKINEIETQRTQAETIAKDAQEIAEIAKNEVKSAQDKLQAHKNQMQALSEEYEQKIAVIEEKYLEKIDLIQAEAEKEIASLSDTIEELHRDYSTNYVKKVEAEKALARVEMLSNVVDELEERMNELNAEELRSKEKLLEYEQTFNTLRHDLDNATVQYSEAVLEKTKIASEKASVEQELSKVAVREADLQRHLEEVKNELTNVRHAHQKQLAELHDDTAKLEVRNSELESSNAELHNRLVKIQVGCGDHTSAGSPPTTNHGHHHHHSSTVATGCFVDQIVSLRRQTSESETGVGGYGYYGYDDHEEQLRSRSYGGRLGLVVPVNQDADRNEANSSPDLGIESDQGRFSSLETHLNVPRPLLQTLELTESMSNLLDGDHLEDQSVCESEHRCCQKVVEMAHKNTDLNRKLSRTRRALEETLTQLSLANQRKKLVEKKICKQIHQTSQVLRKAKANLDSGSETDVYKK